MARVRNIIRGKTILITGGTGSFGNSFVSKILELKPKKVIIFSRDEKKQFDMRNKYNNRILKFIIGDVRDYEEVEDVMQGVDFVFHAAALKQVPTTEFFPMEAVKTNILGGHNVIRAAIKNGVKKTVILSTDKAVYPINAMGLSKALQEKIMIAESRNFGNKNKKTIVCGVRYGNVLYTRGSVVPHFVSQIRQNKKLTVTNFEMTRFLLPLNDAVDLVLFALESGENGYIYVKKSPASTLKTLAQAVCEIFSYKEGYEEVGIRAGEKLHETLISMEEMMRAVESGSFYKIPPESQGLDYNQYLQKGKKKRSTDVEPFTSANTKILNISETKKLLLSLPEVKFELNGHKVNNIKKFKPSIYSVLE